MCGLRFLFFSEIAKISDLKIDGIAEKINDARSQAQAEEARRIIAWLSPLSFRATHLDVLESVHPGTGRWALENDALLRWTRGECDSLWCPGIRKCTHKPRISNMNLKILTQLMQRELEKQG